jgi:hypothetical protein
MAMATVMTATTAMAMATTVAVRRWHPLVLIPKAVPGSSSVLAIVTTAFVHVVVVVVVAAVNDRNLPRQRELQWARRSDHDIQHVVDVNARCGVSRHDPVTNFDDHVPFHDAQNVGLAARRHAGDHHYHRRDDTGSSISISISSSSISRFSFSSFFFLEHRNVHTQ